MIQQAIRCKMVAMSSVRRIHCTSKWVGQEVYLTLYPKLRNPEQYVEWKTGRHVIIVLVSGATKRFWLLIRRKFRCQKETIVTWYVSLMGKRWGRQMTGEGEFYGKDIQTVIGETVGEEDETIIRRNPVWIITISFYIRHKRKWL